MSISSRPIRPSVPDRSWSNDRTHMRIIYPSIQCTMPVVLVVVAAADDDAFDDSLHRPSPMMILPVVAVVR